mmetsp:Transcript_61393/g.121456  ORF Transcript_61393/g.121456 Transcript_61393/m.121456 type:complete len:396 (-) Transcript_61393:277-1464(-)|eukprot:CAMPEP_0174714278 /NCGR_PEP_ID=MMETSP1094-20130205/17532_1 /TAXON_ID=156173 /ORGANISM="Chrysochromulina brevifilum, Strain UTEX LB 985" /LENGTH=395 /DNA_ID=CAMNT_0015913607 /DNA_START=85 /DNA_END=1275 /DNA_ORIENTATION=-
MAQYLRSAVREMKAYTPGEQINNAIKLNTNECAWGPAKAVLEAVAALTPDQLRLYPSPMADRVRAAAADVFKVSASQVLVGNGSDDCLTVIMRSFLTAGDKCACPWPTYSLYDTLATIQGVEIAHASWLAEPDPLLAQRGVASSGGGVAGWHLPISALLESGAKVVFVATPNNPSATLVPLEQLDLLASELKGILVVDEAYIDYATNTDGTPAGLSASFLPRLASRPNVLVLRTFSKSYSMAGARLGLMFASEELTNHMGKVKDSYNVNALTQVAGEAALRDRDHFDWLIGATIKEREWLEAECKTFGWSWPRTSANFIFFDLGSVELAAALYAKLKGSGLLVRYWGSRPDLASRLRVTVGERTSNEKFVTLVKAALAEPAIAALVPKGNGTNGQ